MEVHLSLDELLRHRVMSLVSPQDYLKHGRAVDIHNQLIAIHLYCSPQQPLTFDHPRAPSFFSLRVLLVYHSLVVMDGLSSSIFVQDDAPVYDMPVSAINRPLPSTLDGAKVQQFVEDMQVGL